MYEAIICKIQDIKPIDNCDNIVLGNAAGHNVIVSKETKESQLGVFFNNDGQLSKDFCYYNNLHKDKSLNRDKTKHGFFENNRRVKTIKLREQLSFGFWCPIEFLSWTGINIKTLNNGFTFTELNGKKICQKYFTQATKNFIKQKQGKKSKHNKTKYNYPQFVEHFDTKHLRSMVGSIPNGSIITISEKLHGTSHRVSRTLKKYKFNKLKQLCNKHLPLKFKDFDYEYVSGSRRVTLNNKKTDDGYYKNNKFRQDINKQIEQRGIKRGESIFGEIVGYVENDKPIMAIHKPKEKALKEKYGNKFCYSYGCEPNQSKFYVYRITQTSLDGNVIELSNYQMRARCSELGLNCVPLLEGPFIYYQQDKETLLNVCKVLSEGDSSLDNRHLKEGVVIRVEGPNNYETFFKYKSWDFMELEGFLKNKENYVDLEEIS